MKNLAALTYLCISVIILLSGCGGSSGGGDTGDGGGTDPDSNQAPAAVITGDTYTTSGGILDGSTSSDPEGDSLTYSWTESTSAGVTFGNNTGETTTVEFSAWDDTDYQAAVSITVRLTVSDGENEDYADFDVIIYRSDYAYVMNGASGDGSSPDNAAGDINTAITYADTNAKIAVAVSAETYEVDHDSDTHIQMLPGIALCGGYSTDFTSRDTSVYETVIIDMSAEPSNSWGQETCAVFFNDSSIDSSTVLDGMTVKGHTIGRLGQAVLIYSGSPAIQNCILVGGGGNNSSGLMIRYSGSGVIQNNIISGSTTVPDNTRGIILYNNSPASGNTLIQGNTISGGGPEPLSASASPIGIFVSGSSDLIVTGNSIDGGNGIITKGIYIRYDCSEIEISGNTLISGGTSSGNAYAIHAEQSTVIEDNYIECTGGGISRGISADHASSSPSILNNTIVIDTSSNFCCGISIASSSPSITDNTIYSLSSTYGYGIYESSETSDPATVTGNNIYNCPQALYFDDETADIAADQVNVDGYFTDGTSIVEDGNTDYSGNTSSAP